MSLNDSFSASSGPTGKMSVSRRSVLIGGCGGLVWSAHASARAARRPEWSPSMRLPDPAVQTLDPAFNDCVNGLSRIERLGTGFAWAEGPVWLGESGILVFSDVRKNQLMQWQAKTGLVSIFRSPSNFSDGNSCDRQGRLLSCESLTRRVTRTELDGSMTVLMDRFDGQPLNSPNDIVCRSDGSIWFTDPRFGPNFAEEDATPSLPANVYRLDPVSRVAQVVAGDVDGPNGLCFSPDEKTLYIIASRAKPNRQILAYDVRSDGTLGNKRVFFDCGQGAADGLRADTSGNLWCGWGSGEGLDGVVVLSPQGRKIGQILLPERCANLCFGGVHRNELFMTAHTSLYKLTLKNQGVALV